MEGSEQRKRRPGPNRQTTESPTRTRLGRCTGLATGEPTQYPIALSRGRGKFPLSCGRRSPD
eukprot:8809559-Alexandrium_andersonii.AAC.1